MDRSLGNNAITTAILGLKAREFKQVHIDASKSCPCCDIENKVIYSPFFGNVVNHEDDMMVRGYNEHEAGHARFSPADLLKSFRTPAERQLCNALEDERIERGVASLYPIFGDDLRHLNDVSIRQLGQRMRENPPANPVTEATIALHIQSDGFSCGWDISASARRLMEVAREAYAKGAAATCDKRGVKVVKEAVEEIARLWKDEIDSWGESEDGEGFANPFADGEDGDGKSEGKQQSGGKGGKGGKSSGSKGSDDGESQGGDGEEQSSGKKSDGKRGKSSGKKPGKSEDKSAEDGKDGSAESGKDGKDDGSEDGGKSSSGDDGDGKDGKGEDGKEQSAEKGVPAGMTGGSRGERMLECATDENAIEKMRQDILRALAQKCHTTYIPYEDDDRVETPDPNPVAFRDLERVSNRVSSRLQSALEDTLRSLSRKRKRHHREDGQLDDTMMVDICKSLSDNIFYDLGKALSLKDTKVMLLVDESGSMSGSKIRIAGALAVAFGNVLDAIGVPFSVVGHTTLDVDYADKKHRTDLLRQGFVRVEPLLIREYKDFGADWLSERERLGGIDRHPLVQNVDSDAVKYCCKRLLAQQCERRVLLILSDGYPACQFTDTRVLSKDLKETVESFREAGVEIVGVGINTRSVKEFYGEGFSVNVDDLDDLSEEFFEMMEHTLVQGQEA